MSLFTECQENTCLHRGAMARESCTGAWDRGKTRACSDDSRGEYAAACACERECLLRQTRWPARWKSRRAKRLARAVSHACASSSTWRAVARCTRQGKSSGKRCLDTRPTGALPVGRRVRKRELAASMLPLVHSEAEKVAAKAEAEREGANRKREETEKKEDRPRTKMTMILCRRPVARRPVGSCAGRMSLVRATCRGRSSSRACARAPQTWMPVRSPLCLVCDPCAQFRWRLHRRRENAKRKRERAAFSFVSRFLFPFGNEKTEKNKRTQGNAPRKLF